MATKADETTTEGDVATLPAEVPEGQVIVKQNPEVPSVAQIQASVTTAPAPPEVTVTVPDAATGEAKEQTLDVSDSSMVTSRAQAASTTHPANAGPGYSNPALKDATEEEKAADQAAWEARFG